MHYLYSLGIVLAYLLLLLIMARAFKDRVGLNKVMKSIAGVLLILGIIFIGVGWVLTADDGDAYLVTGASFDEVAYMPHVYSDDQFAIFKSKGIPSGFSLFFLGEGSVERQETWFYKEEGYAVTFLNGIMLYEEEDPSISEMAFGTSYDPSLFIYELDPGTILSRIQQRDFLVMPVDRTLLEEGTLYYCEDLVIGFSGGRLTYAESLIDGEAVSQ